MNTLNFTHQSHSPLRVRGSMTTSKRAFPQKPSQILFDITREDGKENGGAGEQEYCNYCQIKLESDRDGVNMSFTEHEDITASHEPNATSTNPPDSGSTPTHHQTEMNISPNKKANVFDAEWRGKVDILTLKLSQRDKYPLKVYGKAGQYMDEACLNFNYEKSRGKVYVQLYSMVD